MVTSNLVCRTERKRFGSRGRLRFLTARIVGADGRTSGHPDNLQLDTLLY
jgi:hypothetical protein